MASMTATLNLEELRELHRLLASICTDCRLEIEPDSWRITAIDPAHVALIKLEISRDALGQQYEAQQRDVILDVERLGTMLKHAPRKGHIVMEMTDNVITWEAEEMRWRQRLDEGCIPPIRVPDLEYQGMCVAERNDLAMAGRMASGVDDNIRLHLDGGTLRLMAGDSGDDAEMTLRHPSNLGTARVLLPLDYWQKAIKAIPQPDIFLDLGTDLPAALHIAAWDKALLGTYLIAPRIEGGA